MDETAAVERITYSSGATAIIILNYTFAFFLIFIYRTIGASIFILGKEVERSF